MSFFKLDIDLRITGFDTPEIDIIMTGLPSSEEDVRDNLLPPATKGPPATKIGDLWILGDHRLYCGSATCLDSYHILMGEEKATAIISDPPFNCKNEGHTGGKGKIKHENFIECYGEKSEEGFTDFLTGYLGNAASVLVEGGLGYSFMDWRNQYAMLTAIRRAHLIQINLVIWNKNNGAMGSFYRSKHEMVHVFKKGSASHINNVELGKHGRYRTNVWDYAGINTFRPGRLDELSMHPTVKPVAMIADAIMDCTNKGDIVLDPFMGSGTIFIACEKTGRSAYAMDLDPIYVDTAIRRWQKYTGKDAIHAGTGRSFAEIITAGGINE